MLIHCDPDPERAAAARGAILADERLTFAARGLLLSILAHAPEWQVNADKLSVMARASREDRAESRSALRSLLNELKEVGYLQRSLQPSRRGRGNLVGTRTDVFDTAQEVPPPAVAQLNPVPEPKRPVDRTGSVVYVIGSPGSSTVKIGTSSRLKRRLAGIQTSCPMPLEVLWSHSGDYQLEAKLHDRFARYRTSGEWFDFGKVDPVASISRFVKQLDREWYEATEAALKQRLVEQGLPVE